MRRGLSISQDANDRESAQGRVSVVVRRGDEASGMASGEVLYEIGNTGRMGDKVSMYDPPSRLEPVQDQMMVRRHPGRLTAT